MKKIIISIIFIILIVIIAGIYKFNYLPSQSGYDCDGNKISDLYKSEILLKWFNLKSSSKFYVKIPNTNIKSEIYLSNILDSSHYAKGDYKIGDKKGEIIINNIKIISLNQSTENIEYLVIPFYVLNQNKGQMNYIGLFKLYKQTKIIDHVSSYYLGKNIKINSINYNGLNKIKLKIKDQSNFELKILNLDCRDLLKLD